MAEPVALSRSSGKRFLSPVGSCLAPLGCGLTAAGLMFINLSYGLPFYYHPDELDILVKAIGIGQDAALLDFKHPHFLALFSIPFVYGGNALGAGELLSARAAVAMLGVATVFLLGSSAHHLFGGRTRRPEGTAV